MPICEIDPWRVQYFERVPCPVDVFIPTEDSDAWLWNPRHRWVYDKLTVALSQGLDGAPHGVTPPSFPVFSKPIYNLKGMGIGSRAIATAEEMAAAQTAGHMWSTLLQGDHISSDLAVVDGLPRWWRHARGQASGDGTFDHWELQAEAHATVESWCGQWSEKHLKGYTGMVNLETIGGRIIECHLRFADQWPDLYGGDAWVRALVGLYRDGRWLFDDGERCAGYSVVLFMPHGPRYRPPPETLLREVRAMQGVSSVQVTFHADLDPDLHAMPPGGFRTAIVNCWDRPTGNLARERLRAHFADAKEPPRG